MKKGMKTATVEVSDLDLGSTVRLSDGTLAEVLEIGEVNHTETQLHKVKVVTYKLLEGPFKGARNTTPLFGSDEIEIIPEKVTVGDSVKSWFKSIFG